MQDKAQTPDRSIQHRNDEKTLPVPEMKPGKPQDSVVTDKTTPPPPRPLSTLGGIIDTTA